MATKTPDVTEQLHAGIEQPPERYRALLLRLSIELSPGVM